MGEGRPPADRRAPGVRHFWSGSRVCSNCFLRLAWQGAGGTPGGQSSSGMVLSCAPVTCGGRGPRVDLSQAAADQPPAMTRTSPIRECPKTRSPNQMAPQPRRPQPVQGRSGVRLPREGRGQRAALARPDQSLGRAQPQTTLNSCAPPTPGFPSPPELPKRRLRRLCGRAPARQEKLGAHPDPRLRAPLPLRPHSARCPAGGAPSPSGTELAEGGRIVLSTVANQGRQRGARAALQSAIRSCWPGATWATRSHAAQRPAGYKAGVASRLAPKRG